MIFSYFLSVRFPGGVCLLMSVSRISSKVKKRSGMLLGHGCLFCMGGSRRNPKFWGSPVRWLSLPPTCQQMAAALLWKRVASLPVDLVPRRKSQGAAKCSVCRRCERPASECVILQSERPEDCHRPLGRALQGSEAETWAAVPVMYRLSLPSPSCCLSCESEISLEKVLR